jgi:hypothetical protein
MSFLGVLKAIGHGVLVGLGAAEKLSPEIAMIPMIGAPASAILSAIAAVEQAIPNGGGAAKKTAATTLVNATAPGIDPATLSSTIDSVVAGLNTLTAALAALKAPSN